jgi:hypothetical protein
MFHSITGADLVTVPVGMDITLQVGKYGTPTRCNNNSFIDLQDQLNMFRASFCPSSGAQD